MSVTSSATASRDWEVSPTNSFRNRLCLLSITKGDVTPMDASSILEEDIVEICIQKGHICPLGMLHYSAMESIILFGTVDNLTHASQGLADVTEFCDEAIMVQTMALLEAHITAFTSVWHSKPTSGDRELHTPPEQTPPSEGTPCHLYAQLGDLNDNELQQIISDLLQEIAQCKLTVPPRNPLQMNGYTHQAVEGLRRMIRRSPFQEGEGGVHWGSPPQFQSNHLQEGFPLDHHSNCHVLHQWAANYCPNIGSAHWHPKHKYLHWQHGTW